MATEQPKKMSVHATSDLQQYQGRLRDLLARTFREAPVNVEWQARVELDGRSVYSPRLDVAVGPFAIEENQECVYEEMVGQHCDLLQRLFEAHRSNLAKHDVSVADLDFYGVINRNRNARCFVAIEIENNVSRKHLMGGAINAAALGRVGVVVGWSGGKVSALIRLRAYLLFLARVGKNSFDPTNLLILSPEQLMRCVGRPRRLR